MRGDSLRYVPELDGLRAVSVLAVLAYHAGVPGMSWGFLGVDVFFVISGYLITRLLMERDEPISHFYIKRAARLYPALLLMLAAYVLATGKWNDAVLAALYLTDYTAAIWHEPIGIIHTWSLSVEEHFYLLWPLALPFAAKARNPARLMLVLWAASTLWRYANFDWLGWQATYHRFDTRTSGIFLGAALAFGLRVPAPLMMLAVPAIALGNILAGSGMGFLFATPLAEFAAAASVLSAPRQLARFAGIGVLSYGIYLWHLPVIALLAGTPWLIKLLAGAALSCALSFLSYRSVERPVREWVRKRIEQRLVTAAT